MPQKKKISYEQDLALAHGRQVARSNQRRRVAANQQREREDAERERAAAIERERWAKQRTPAGGEPFAVGARVRGLESHWRVEQVTGVVLDAPGDGEGGFPILTDEGETVYVLTNRTQIA